MNASHALSSNTKREARGFTLIEMVGVLAVIAILAALLVPKIFAAINDSRFSNTVATLNSCKTATMSYFGKAGQFPSTNAFDQLLVASDYLERPFATKLGTSGFMQVVVGPGAGGQGYVLDGATTNATAANMVVECVISNVPAADAVELSTRVDGLSLSTNSLTAGENLGRVSYAPPAGSPLVTTVYVYMAAK